MSRRATYFKVSINSEMESMIDFCKDNVSGLKDVSDAKVVELAIQLLYMQAKGEIVRLFPEHVAELKELVKKGEKNLKKLEMDN